MAKKNLSAAFEVVEIDGNEFRLPTSMTPRLRAQTGQLEAAYIKARAADLRAQIAMSEAGDADGVVKADAAVRKAAVATADAARKFVAALLTTADGQPAPDGVDDAITDHAALDLAATLADGGQVELDPPSAA